MTGIAPQNDPDLLENIRGHVQGPVDGFFDKFFQHIQYDRVFPRLAVRRLVNLRYGIPFAPTPNTILPWFKDFLSQKRVSARGTWIIAPDEEDVSCGEGKVEGIRIFLAIPLTAETCGAQNEWLKVHVIRQFYPQGASIRYQEGLLCLCRSAQQVFIAQPTRLFLHGFYIRGTEVESWVFDRSGLFCSSLLDMTKDYIGFLSAILCYQHMTDEELGVNDMVKTDTYGNYIVFETIGKLYLDSQPIAFRIGLIGKGTTCYRARKDRNSALADYVVKFKWCRSGDHPKNQLRNLAMSKGIWGAVSLDYYKEFMSTASLRHKLKWKEQRRSRSACGEQTSIYQRTKQEENANTTGIELNEVAYSGERDEIFQNRVFTCIVTSPVGRPLHTFESPVELLEVFRDAIICHRSLYQDANILHRNVTPWNILIRDHAHDQADQNDGKSDGSLKPRSILIGLSAARNLTSESDLDLDKPKNTGMEPFMAIGVLKHKQHTYRHDLESFLYVFLWTIISFGSAESGGNDGLHKTSRLHQWSNVNHAEIARLKSHDMTRDRFLNILKEFEPQFSELKWVAERLRWLLFPFDNEIVVTSTGVGEAPECEDVDWLYDEFISAFEDAIIVEDGGENWI